MPRGLRPWSTAAIVAVAIGAAWLLLDRPPETSPYKTEVALRPTSRIPPARERRRPELSGHAPGVPDGDETNSLGAEDMNGTWEGVDLAKVREAMPDNLYWKLSEPTKDERIIEEREAERDRWNVEYGKILSGNASEDEIRAYYDRRSQLSGDYIEFATYLLDHYGDTLPERDVGMLTLARRLNQARLEEIPRKLEEAFERKRQQDEARAAWLADQAAFEGGQPAAGDR
jgi:hypothetical protein